MEVIEGVEGFMNKEVQLIAIAVFSTIPAFSTQASSISNEEILKCTGILEYQYERSKQYRDKSTLDVESLEMSVYLRRIGMSHSRLDAKKANKIIVDSYVEQSTYQNSAKSVAKCQKLAESFGYGRNWY
ncbi:hypothetical protein ACPV5U_18550 [Vibrio mediterranei]